MQICRKVMCFKERKWKEDRNDIAGPNNSNS